jgi:hypothetical protein
MNSPKKIENNNKCINKWQATRSSRNEGMNEMARKTRPMNSISLSFLFFSFLFFFFVCEDIYTKY